MLIIYTVDINGTDFLVDDYLKYLSNYRQKRIEKLITKARKQTINQTVVGELLLRYILIQHYNFKMNEIILKESNEGKPYLVDGGIYFNISHSNDMVMCGCDQWPIGIDIQYVKKTVLLDPFEFSAKEAYGKMIGCGLNFDDTITYCKRKHFSKIYDKYEGHFIYQVYLGDYVVSVASESFNIKKGGVKIQKLQCCELLHEIKNGDNYG